MPRLLVCLLLLKGMSVLILKNIVSEGPGTIEEYLQLADISYRIHDMTDTKRLPDLTAFDTLVMLGGPMSVNDNLAYIRYEEMLARGFMVAGKKTLGICLGAQIMAKALGAGVYAGPEIEAGWSNISLCDEGLRDPLMTTLEAQAARNGSADSFKVFQWHVETFDIPDVAQRLAYSGLYPNQAFRFGRESYAFQFHIEVTEKMIVEWMTGAGVDMNKLNVETGKFYGQYKKMAFAFYRQFFGGQSLLTGGEK
jgi:GMP synthase (glutamine-hydrolysing)